MEIKRVSIAQHLYNGYYKSLYVTDTEGNEFTQPLVKVLHSDAAALKKLAIEGKRIRTGEKEFVKSEWLHVNRQCPKCGGTGKAYGGMCYQCQGEGRMSRETQRRTHYYWNARRSK